MLLYCCKELKMKTPNVILFLLLAVCSTAVAAQSPAVLLQQGIYAEQTEGDLDKAMEIYSRIREEYNDVERVSARATYQLGLCHLKKGDKETAVKYFEEVIGYFPEQKSVVQMAQQQLDKLGISKDTDKNIFEILGPVSSYIGSKYGEICAEAGTKKLYSNSHIYLVDKDFVLRKGGMGYIYNWTTEPITKPYRISGTTTPNHKLYDITGNEMNVEILPNENQPNFYHVYWTPKEPLMPGAFFNYGWATEDSSRLPAFKNGYSRYSLTMQNHFGGQCYETFFLVVSEGIAITSQSEDYTNKGNANGWDIYWWKKEVPANTTHIVNVVITAIKPVSEEELKKIVNKTILTISTCAETDPKVAESLNSLKELDQNSVVSQIVNYLDDIEAAIRRSAIFALWRGEFASIEPAEDKLLGLCSHEENYTRGMAALALGSMKVSSSYETLKDMTLNDKDGYVRRCAAYALGLYGDKEALAVLEKALQDSDPMVKDNAHAAITMLTKLNDPNKNE